MFILHVNVTCWLTARGNESKHPDAETGKGVKSMLLQNQVCWLRLRGIFYNPIEEVEDRHTVLARAAFKEVIRLCKSEEDSQYFYDFSEERLVWNFLSLL